MEQKQDKKKEKEAKTHAINTQKNENLLRFKTSNTKQKP